MSGEALAARPCRRAPRLIARPAPPRAALPRSLQGRRQGRSRSWDPAATPARKRPPSPTYSPRLRGARPGPRLPRLPARRTPSPTTPRARSASPASRAPRPGPASPRGGPFRRAASRPSARSSAAPHAFPSSRFADSTRSLRAPRRNACPRKGGGRRKRREGGSSRAWSLYWGQSGESLTDPRTKLAKPTCRLLAPGLASRPRARRGQRLPRSHVCPEKPKVYQGVRVKITVKELLQQRRAHQAASGGTLSGGNSVHLSDPVPPSSAGQYFEPEPIPSTPNYFQPREFSSCVSCEENPDFLDQIFDSYLQTETHPDPSPSSMQSTPHYFPDSFQPAPFCFNQSLTPGWPSDSSTLSGSLDYSYSPAQLPSYTPENYTSPPSLDTRNCGYPSEDYSYPHLPSHTQYNCFSSATASVCCCASCEAEHLDTFRASECISYPSTDYVNFTPSAAASSDFCRRETNWDICYS
ncbi:POU class 2 homeobox associating factor 3 [Orcinus orca]|uniref:POU class 2 homeobox associating factor 3 n=1 Tax=Orcinus orca TaxID=9733 RepID=UPI002111285D|nr:POU class 2 homeobox associating factor 3 [Orcinus orca]